MSENSLSAATAGANGGAEDKKNRREFLNALIGFSFLVFFAGALDAVVSFLRPPQTQPTTEGPVEIGAESDIPPGTGKVVPFKETTAIVIHTDAGEWAALSAVCTHLGCLVQWDAQRGQIHCPCHGGFFDIKGNVLAGPPPAPLKTYGIEVIDSKIVVREA